MAMSQSLWQSVDPSLGNGRFLQIFLGLSPCATPLYLIYRGNTIPLIYNSPYTYSNSSYISCEPLVGGMVSRIDRNGWSGVSPISGWRWLKMVCLGKRNGMDGPDSMPTE